MTPEDGIAKKMGRPFDIEKTMDTCLVVFTKYEMKEKLEKARLNGRHGWWNDTCSNSELKRLLISHIEKGHYIDVVNLAAMIHYRKESGIEL